MGYVYLIKEEESDDNKYKIGMTNKTLEERMNSLQIGNPNKLVLIDYYQSKNPRDIEKTLHNLLRNKNILREWFDLNDDDVKQFKSLCETIENNIKILSNNPYSPYRK